jgi:hypothetical protein
MRKTLIRSPSLGFSYKEDKDKRFTVSRQQSESTLSDKEKRYSRQTDQTVHIDTDKFEPSELTNGHQEFKQNTASQIMSLNKTVLNSNPIPIPSSKTYVDELTKNEIKEEDLSMPEKIKTDTIMKFNQFLNEDEGSENDDSDDNNKNKCGKQYAKSSSKNYDSLDNDKDEHICMLEKEIENMKNIHENLEDVFQSKITNFIERIIELEDEQESEIMQHEDQIISLLKASGIYHKSGYDRNNRPNNHDLWMDLLRVQLDDERIKIRTLKTIMMRFSDRLTKADNNMLLDAGIILVESGQPDD